ncbi:hypothetical protein WJX73_010743 [Symbiochloris irregularis]|uniref:FAD-binding domain-containing protein n=1 Tax=Symbiochloris irregularis TaxID=706552 RepID=A0AAW1P1F4_9CHLO
MVGAALAQALRSNPWTSELRLVLLDRQGQPEAGRSWQGPPELRVSTVTPASVALLQQAQVWTDLQPPRSAGFNRMQVWDWAGSGYIQYSASEVGLQHMGYVVENSMIQGALLKQLLQPGNTAKLMFKESVSQMTLPPYSQSGLNGQSGNALASLQLESGRQVRARLVVGADGAQSHMRSLACLRTSGWAYGQHGVVATVRTDVPHSTAWQRFLPRGPLALLPVRDGLSSVVWTTSPRHARELTSASPLAFALAVNQALSGGATPARNPLLAGVRGPGQGSERPFHAPPQVVESVGPSPRSFPLHLRHAGRYVRPRFALVGDAAHAVHPLAGQGVNLGFGDVGALVSTLAHAVEAGRDIGELTLLEEMYERPRQRANVSMMAALDALKRVFVPQTGLLATARGLGLDALNAFPLAKNRVMMYAMGE